ncbi:glutaredoxin 2 [Pseudoalteromonas sp. Cnat2-41]|uniref:glutaredoxin 2 n=1 Tax=unclassified Pseudoalteromonas TaxID=194690 RepID=UPI001EF83065|nr:MULTISPECIES: glutaredoxin 2 [unclassified Pseudoalteromonas]MCF2862486.1 glutaredoxin 2 [Pseudoalteromonas sp. CNAT2-18]MCG7559062.1 glutaredoxin 2 [Pseudoalteromonas sp. CNAT2-18.1]
MKLFIFEHCPYCIKSLLVARALGLEVDVRFLLNDDEATPNQLVGKKIVPILVKDDDTAMAESLDIAEYFCTLANKELSQGEHFSQAQQWVEKHLETFLRLTFVRWPQLALPEYAIDTAISYFREKKEQRLGESFDSVLANSDADIATMEHALSELTWLQTPEHITWADVALFPFLRNLTVVKGLTFPEHVLNYVDTLATEHRIKTFTRVAI